MVMDSAVKRRKRKIHVSLNVQIRTSYLEHLSLFLLYYSGWKHCKKQHADIQDYHVGEDTIAMLNAPNNALIGEFIHQHPMGPIVWEQTQYEQDSYYCENNIITSILLNVQIIPHPSQAQHLVKLWKST
jgi:hypothetical protein